MEKSSRKKKNYSKNYRIVFATRNRHKMKEIRDILAGIDMPVYSMEEAGIDIEIAENGSTFEENAMIKARAVSSLLPDDIIIADDSGLEIDYLDKAPGIFSSRFAGEDTPYSLKNQIILKMLEGVPDRLRTARFVCAVAAVCPDGESFAVKGTIEGIISHETAGENGFGYDPVFYVPEYGCTTAQMSGARKNQLSHRGKALRKMRGKLEEKYKSKENDNNGKWEM